MAKVEKNPFVRGISGGLGDMVFRQMPNGETWISGKPDFSKHKPSKRQKKHRSLFKQAVEYAREASKTQPIYAQLAAGTVKSPYNWALSDWFNPPVIHSVKRKDGKIRVNATDNVLVAKVVVTILDEEGKVIEKGEGIRGEGDWWEVETNAKGKVIAEAWDLAENRVESGV